MNCGAVVSCCELTGNFDFMIEAKVRDLQAYNDKLAAIKEPLARLVFRYEAHFICKRFVRADREGEDKRALWVPCQEGIKRIDFSLIDKVTAEGDYIRLHTRSERLMVHMTMREMGDRLEVADFVALHRSAIVRCGFIRRLRHEGRTWTATLEDGSIERIAKSKVVSVLAKLRTDSSKPEAHSAKDAQAGDPAPIARRILDAPLAHR